MKYKGLELSKLKDEEVLFFIRIRGKKSYFKNVYTQKFINLFENVREYRCISEYKKDADVHIDINAVKRDYLYKNEYIGFSKIVDVDDVIARCRGLRSIPYENAKKLINRAYLFFLSYYREYKNLKIIAMGTIDNYIMDVMVRVGENMGIKFIAITDSFLSPEYKLSTVRGEFNPIGNFDESDIVKFKQKILHSINNAKKPSIKNIIKNNIYYYSSYVYRYFVRYLYKHKLLGRLEYEYIFAPYLHMIYSFDQLFALRFLTYKYNFSKVSDKKAYIPLHFYPEATTDYWIDDIYDIEYLTSVLNTVKRLQKLGYKVFAKEHPHFFLSRRSEFYKELLKNNVVIISPFITTKEIFDNVDLVVVWNGSTGIESMVYGKQTVKVTNSYYADDYMSNLEDLENNKYCEFNLDKCIEKVYQTSFRTC